MTSSTFFTERREAMTLKHRNARAGPHPTRRKLVLGLPLTALVALSQVLPAQALAHAEHNLVNVWKTVDCDCCKQWIAHLRKSGLKVVSSDVKDTADIRRSFDFPDKYAGCHTAMFNDYVIEGHVPARELLRLQREKPKARGLAVPGMPIGSPGMESGSQRDAYSVLLVLEDGSSRVYQSYPANTS